MKEIDLELYRWNWYKLRIKDIKANRNAALGLRTFWSSYGVFISTLPRQVGKSTMLIRMAETLENEGERFLIVVPNEQMKKHFGNIAPNIHADRIRSNPGAMTSFYHHTIDDRPENIHLLVDEYDYIHEQAVGNIMNQDWKSLTMVGSYKLRAI